jgi:hypothetical protein
MIMNDELERMQMESVLTCSKILCWHMPGKTGKKKKNHDTEVKEAGLSD